MKNIYRAALSVYLIALAFAVFTPRPDIADPLTPPLIPNGPSFAAKVGHNILYTDDYWQWIGNFVMLIPFAVLMHLVFGKMQSRSLILLSSSVSALIEFTQLFIPGRVSDLRDFIFNSVGMVISMFVIRRANVNRR